jgi:hypothetical protein
MGENLDGAFGVRFFYKASQQKVLQTDLCVLTMSPLILVHSNIVFSGRYQNRNIVPNIARPVGFREQLLARACYEDARRLLQAQL